MWTDVRVCSDDVVDAINAVAEHSEVTNIRCNLTPPAAGPEAELSFEDVPEAEVRGLLEPRGIFVLASRTRPPQAIIHRPDPAVRQPAPSAVSPAPTSRPLPPQQQFPRSPE